MSKIKICGINHFKEIEYVNEVLPDYVGFVFAQSRRKVDFNKAYLLKSELDSQITTVGVFVNEDIGFIKRCCDHKIIDMIQLHGNEGYEYIRSLRNIVYKPIIKAVRVKANMNFERETFCAKTRSDEPDYLLFDTYTEGAYGGTGKVFDWRGIPSFDFSFFLAGGINSQNVQTAIEQVNPYCIDISSGVEKNGIKDRSKIHEIVTLIRNMG